jgi:hypothetical protein
MTAFAAHSVHLMEQHLSTSLQILRDSNSPLVEDLLKESRSVSELQPATTRLCLLKLQEEISKNNSNPSGLKNGAKLT